MPDIAMLPNIANFFGVSIDRIFDFTLTESDSPENIIQRVKETTDRLEFDYKKHLLTLFELFEKDDTENFKEMQVREDFRRFFEKLNRM